MKRLFFALWPDEETRQQCRKIIRAVRGHGRSVSQNNLHVTLVFLGNVDENKQAAMTQAAADVVARSMTLIFNRLYYWKKPAVLCLGADSVDPAVSILVSELTSAAVRNDIAVDSRPYKPHVTLLRKAQSLPDIQFKPVIWQADSFCLMESCSTPNGVEYRPIESWTCTRAPALG